jgi:hypothetical protein
MKSCFANDLSHDLADAALLLRSEENGCKHFAAASVFGRQGQEIGVIREHHALVRQGIGQQFGVVCFLLAAIGGCHHVHATGA